MGTINIKLTKDNGIRLAEPFTLKENEKVVINFETEYELSAAKIFLRNKNVCGAYDFKKLFTIPDKFMFVGKLYIKVEMYFNGSVVKRWEMFPLDLKQTPEGLCIIEYFKYLEDKFDQLKEDVLALQKAHEIIK